MTLPRPAPLDKQLCFSLYSASLAMTQVYKPLLEPLDLTYPQYLIMLVLWEKDGLNLKDIASKLGQKSGALTPVLKRMEQEGLIERVRSEKDERSLNIKLAAKGEGLRARASEIGPQIAQACALPTDDLIGLKDDLDTLKDNLLAVIE